LNTRGVQQGVLRLGLPQLLDDLAKDRIRFGAAGLQPGPLSFPVVFDGRGDAVAVVAVADLVGGQQRFEGLLDLDPAGISGDRRVQGRGDVLGRTVDALDEL
jgi:hypothetical protein